MKSFFASKFEVDFYLNKRLAQYLELHEETLSPYCLKSMSHIINAHHIWLSCLEEKKAESGLWDQLPLDYFYSFHKQNYEQTISALESVDMELSIEYYDIHGTIISSTVPDVLHQVLMHSNHHRAQIIKELKDLELIVPRFDLIAFN
jgi:uncharacterized damage-inducible protein DinB